MHPAPFTERPYREPEEYFPRRITALVNRDLHREGDDAENLEVDANAMLDDDLLDDQDRRFLNHALKACLRFPDDGSPKRIVSMSNRQFSVLVGVRRRYLAAKRERHNALTRKIFSYQPKQNQP